MAKLWSYEYSILLHCSLVFAVPRNVSVSIFVVTNQLIWVRVCWCLFFNFGPHRFPSSNVGPPNRWTHAGLWKPMEALACSLVWLEKIARGNCFMSILASTLCWRARARGNIHSGTEAERGALLLTIFKEEDLSESHTIVPDGYDIRQHISLIGWWDKEANSKTVVISLQLQPLAQPVPTAGSTQPLPKMLLEF